MILVDTTVWIDYLRGTANGHTSWLDRELDRQRLGLTDLILCGIEAHVCVTQTALDLLARGFHTFVVAEFAF